MNREAAKKLIPIMQAYADGKDVQFKTVNGWHDAPSPTPAFDARFEWRVKPEPKEVWIIYDRDGDARETHSSKDEAEANLKFRNSLSNRYPFAPYTLCHFKEC